MCRSFSKLTEDGEGNGRETRALSRFVVHEMKNFGFLELSPPQMRIPSQPGQTTLGDRGENLSSVLAAICADASRKEILLEWVRKLSPMDVDDLIFDQDAAGRILLRLVEKDGRSVSALSASDGTLRFLAILAALFGPEPASFYFIEELENGIHPTRLSLLVDLIEHQTKRRGIQIVATSHSPQLLQFLSEESLKNTSLVYRLPNHPDAQDQAHPGDPQCPPGHQGAARVGAACVELVRGCLVSDRRCGVRTHHWKSTGIVSRLGMSGTTP